MATTINNTTTIHHVFGNVLKLAIPLTLRTITLEGGVVHAQDSDYYPSTHDLVVIEFGNGPLRYKFNATLRDGHIAVMEDKGTIPVGTYAITVLCHDENGDPRRFKQRTVLDVVDVTADAGIEAGIEFEGGEWYLDAAIYLAIVGENGVGIADITTHETDVSGEYNSVTFTLTNGESYTLFVRNGLSTEQTLPANIVIDEFYVHTDNNYTDSDMQNVQRIDSIANNSFGYVVFDPVSKYINFFAKGDTAQTRRLGYVDASPFLVDANLNSVSVNNNGEMVFQFNQDSNKEPIRLPISLIFNKDNYYTRAQTDNRIADEISSASSGLMAKEDFVYEGSFNLKYGSTPEIVLSHIEGVSIYQEQHSRLFGTSDGRIKGYVGATGSQLFDYGAAPNGLVFLDKTSGLFYRWNGTTWQQVGGSGSGGGYEPPVGGIPKTDLASGVQSSLDAADSAYQKPNGGIPKTDLASDVQTSLGKADTALQSQEQADWNESDSSDPAYIKNKPTIPTKVSDLTNDSGFTSNAGTITGITMNGASKGTSGVVDLGTVITAHQDISGKANASDVYTKTQTDTLLTGKQDTLTFDTTPTANSTKPVTSGGIKTYIDGKATITGITTSQDGSFTISLSDGNSYTVYLNHVHPQYLDVDDIDDYITAGTNVTIAKDSTTGVLTINASGGTQVQANWNESNSMSAAYIQNKPTIPTIPTNVSSFNNDAGYLTSHQSLSGRVQSTDVTNIVVCASELAYNNISPKDSSTLYLIKESNA